MSKFLVEVSVCFTAARVVSAGSFTFLPHPSLYLHVIFGDRLAVLPAFSSIHLPSLPLLRLSSFLSAQVLSLISFGFSPISSLDPGKERGGRISSPAFKRKGRRKRGR
jgi:hypothetical protein